MAKIDDVINKLPRELRGPARCYVDVLLNPDNIDGLVRPLIRSDFQAAYEFLVAQMDGSQLGAEHGRINKLLKDSELRGTPKMSIQQAMVFEALRLMLRVGALAVGG